MKLTVIIPSYNAANTLERAVDSCLIQDFTDYEVIIVDNNSTDSTRKVAAGIARKHAFVTLTSETKQGAAAARNHGSRLAKGEWLQFLDADDVLLAGKWKRQLALITAETAWVIGAYTIVDTGYPKEDVLVSEDPWYGLLYSGGIGCMNSNIFRRDVYLENGGMKESLSDHEDYDLYFRLLCQNAPYEIDTQPSCLYLRPTTPTLSTIDDRGRTQRRVDLTEKIVNHLKLFNPAYYQRNLSFINGAKFRHMRQQGTFDIAAAGRTFQKFFPEGLPLVGIDKSILPPYYFVYILLGYTRTERLRGIIRAYNNKHPAK